MKNTLVATLVVFLAWFALDFLVHGVILKEAYASTPALWRPMGEAKMPLYMLTLLVGAYCFCRIYARWIKPKGAGTGLQYGIWFGVGTGIAMGYGTYAFQPIPYSMALVWFLGHTVEATVAGLVAAALIKE